MDYRRQKVSKATSSYPPPPPMEGAQIQQHYGVGGNPPQPPHHYETQNFYQHHEISQAATNYDPNLSYQMAGMSIAPSNQLINDQKNVQVAPAAYYHQPSEVPDGAGNSYVIQNQSERFNGVPYHDNRYYNESYTKQSYLSGHQQSPPTNVGPSYGGQASATQQFQPAATPHNYNSGPMNGGGQASATQQFQPAATTHNYNSGPMNGGGQASATQQFQPTTTTHNYNSGPMNGGGQASATQQFQPAATPHNYNSGPINIGGQQQQFSLADNMPNPVSEQWSSDNKYKGSTLTYTDIAESPPSISTRYFYEDRGIANPRFVRCSYYTLPSGSKMASNFKLPIGLIAQPFALLESGDTPVSSSYQGVEGPQRCGRCRAYMNPRMTFIDGGNTVLCNLCDFKTSVREDYFCYLDNAGVRLDKLSRPELFQGTYEISTNNFYCRNNVQARPPIYVFMFNVSRNGVFNGMLAVVADILCSLIPHHLCVDDFYIEEPTTNSDAPGAEKTSPKKYLMRVAFVAYDKRVFYFNMRQHAHSKQTVEVSVDPTDSYVPSFHGLVVDPRDCHSQIESLLQELPRMFADTDVVESILGSVIERGLNLIRENNDCGRLFVFHSTFPSFNAPGKLDSRDRDANFGTENEINLFKPQGKYYSNLARNCAENGVSINLFLATNGYIDIATLGVLCETTGGRLFHYPFFETRRYHSQLYADLKRLLSRPAAHDAFAKLRVSNGLRVSCVRGCLRPSGIGEVQMAYLDSDSTLSFEIEHDEDLKPGKVVSLQLAVLFTSVSGQRRIRVHNVYLRNSDDYSEVYRGIHSETMIGVLAKKYCSEMLQQSSVTFVAEKLSNLTTATLICYIKNCKQPSAHFQQLVLPESLKLFPLYINSLIKSDAFLTRKELGQDGRSLAIFHLYAATLPDIILQLYPAIYSLFDFSDGSLVVGNDNDDSLLDRDVTPVRCLYERLSPELVYVMVLPHIFYVWIGTQVSMETYRNLLGTSSVDNIDGTVLGTPPVLDTPLSNTFRRLLKCLARRYLGGDLCSPPVCFVRQGGTHESIFKHWLCESKSPKPKSFSYMEYLCFIHKSINESL